MSDDGVGTDVVLTGPAGLTGLTAADVASRVAAGQTNVAPAATSRSLGAILRGNILTFFNGVLASLFVLVALTGRWQNGLFGLVIVINAGIGVVQELRAKRTLDRIAVLTAPTASVWRDATEHQIPARDVVIDDLLQLRRGDQVVADGRCIDGDGLEIDEALLTGESVPVPKHGGDEVRAGSIVVAGTGRVAVTGVGMQTYASRVTADARRFDLTHSELMAGTTRLLRWITVVMLVVGPLVLISQLRSADVTSWQEAVTGTAAALVGMVPEGLVLLTSLAFLVAALTLARDHTLVQELPAVEGLARVDVVCLDKTGTLTEGTVAMDELIVVGDADRRLVESILTTFATSDPANATAAALASAFTADPLPVADSVAFSSARKWSAISSADNHWMLGAPEIVLDPRTDSDDIAAAELLASSGRRVIALVRAVEQPRVDQPLPSRRALALVSLSEQLRPDAAQTLAYFTAQGVSLKVISGDSPVTVGTVAAAAGVPGVHGAQDAVDARTLPEDLDALGELLETHSAFGRVTPPQKRAMVAALQRKGHVVAMTGDGVNDALALKDADIGVAMGSGSAATRGVAQIVLLDSSFAHLPRVVAEGRRVTANIERAASLFLVKNVYSTVLAIVSAITLAAYPLAPIQLTLVSTVTIGVPAFFLALAPNAQRYRPGFLRRVLRFSIPVGLCVAAAAYTASVIARALASGPPVPAARTATTAAVLVVALWTLVVLARPFTPARRTLVVAMAAVGFAVLAITPIAKHVFLLDVTPARLGIGLAVGAGGAVLVEAITRWRPRPGETAARHDPSVDRHSTRSPGRR